MGWIVAGIICWNIGHGIWGTLMIVWGTVILLASLSD